MRSVSNIDLIGAISGQIVGIVDPGPDPPAWAGFIIDAQRSNKALTIRPVIVGDRMGEVAAQIPVGFAIKVWQVVLDAGR